MVLIAEMTDFEADNAVRYAERFQRATPLCVWQSINSALDKINVVAEVKGRLLKPLSC